MADLTFVTVTPAGADDARRDWRHVHNLIIPVSPLSDDEVRERAGRNHLEVAYRGADLVGCSTVRAPDEDAIVTVIARVLPPWRGRGYGTAIYRRGLAQAHQFGARTIATVVLESNVDGLEFARRHGFEETDRYVLPGDPIGYVDLSRPAAGA